MGLISSLVRKKQLAQQEPVDDTSPSPAELSQQYANAHEEPVPWFEKHPYAAGFLAGLAGGEEGVSRLVSVRDAYRQRKIRAVEDQMRVQEVMNRHASERDKLAMDTDNPDLAVSPEVADMIRSRLNAPVPEGYTRNPMNPSELLRPQRPERPVAVPQGSSLVEPGTGRVIMTNPKPPKEPDTAKEDAAAAKDAERRANAMREKNYRLKKDEMDTRRAIARVREEGRVNEIDPLRAQLKMILDEQKAMKRLPGGFAASMGPGYEPPAPPKGAQPFREAGPLAKKPSAAQPYTEPAPGTPKPSGEMADVPGYSKDEIDQLRDAMDEDDRDEFDSYSPEEKKKVLDSAYGRSR